MPQTIERSALTFGFVGGADVSGTPDRRWLENLRNSFTEFAVESPEGGFCGVSSLAPRASDHFDGLSILADAHLHNREELRSVLGPNELWPSDSELILATYRKWGGECPRYLEGEFAFAIWDSRRRKLFACRDHLGRRPFCYRIDGNRISFGSSVSAVLKVPGTVRKLNRRKLSGMASHLGRFSNPDESLYEGITVLGAASSLTVNESGHKVESYWEPRLNTVAVPRDPIEAYGELRRLLFRAVGHRIESGRIACTLSGGLDSSSVSVVAASILGQRGRRVRCYAGVAPGGSAAGIVDEREFIEAVRNFADIDLEYICPAPERGPFDPIDRPTDWGDDLALLDSRDFIGYCIEEAAVRDGVSTVLDGIAGEFGPSCYGEQYFSELALGFQWIKLARCLSSFRATEGRAPFRRVLGEIRAALPGRGWKGPRSAILTPEFLAESEWFVGPPRAFSQQRHQLASIRMQLAALPRTGRTRRGLAYTSTPLMDKPILEFCLSAPPELKVRNGYRRCLIRGALEGLLPPKVLWRTSKAPYSPDYLTRYNSQLPKAREFVASIGSRDPVRALIDVQRLAEMLQPVPPGRPTSSERVAVPRTVYMILFLRQFPEFRA